jgi:hypothetical protein
VQFGKVGKGRRIVRAKQLFLTIIALLAPSRSSKSLTVRGELGRDPIPASAICGYHGPSTEAVKHRELRIINGVQAAEGKQCNRSHSENRLSDSDQVTYALAAVTPRSIASKSTCVQTEN